MKGKYARSFNRVSEMNDKISKTKAHSKFQIQKINSVKRTKKWGELYAAMLKEYHSWIEKELKELD